MAEAVIYEKRGNVAYVTLNRPERMNALGAAVRAGLVDAFVEVREDPEVRAVMVTGTGRAFCAGADLKERAEHGGRRRQRAPADASALEPMPNANPFVYET